MRYALLVCIDENVELSEEDVEQQCEDLDEAIEIAARSPGARYGTIEVRPAWEI